MFIDKLFERRAGQKVPTAANPFYGLLGTDSKSKTGIDISGEEALSSTAVWSAVTQLSQAVASLPLHLYKRLKEGGKDKYINHPLYNLLHLQPNSEMTAFSFRESQMGQILMTGTCYAEIERDRIGNIIGLWPLLSDRMTVMRDKDSGKLYYRYNLQDGKDKIFLEDSILRVNGFSHSGLLGYRTIEKSKEAIALNLAYEEYAARYFGSGARPPLAIEVPEELGQEAIDRLRAVWSKAHEGLSNSQRVAILEAGAKLHEYGFSLQDSQVPELRYFQIDEVCRVFNIPPHMLHNLNRATFNNIEELSRGFVKFSLRYWLVRFEQAYNVQLLNPKEQKKYFFEHVFEGLLRADIKTRYDAYKVGIENGWLNADEIRELENMNPQPDGQGGDYYVPLNWQPKKFAAEKPEPKIEKQPNQEDNFEEIKSFFKESRSIVERDRIIKQYYPLFKQAAQRIVNKETIAIKKQLKQKSEKRANSELEEWLKDFYSKHASYIKDQIGPIFSSFSDAIKSASESEIGIESQGIDKFISDFINRYAERHTESSEGQLIALLEGELEDLEKRIEEWHEKRADKIATNETNRLSNAVYQYIAFGAGMAIYWRTRGPKTCPYCMELSGKRIVSGQSFVNSGDELNPKSGNGPMKIRGIKTHPPLHSHCDCYASVL